MAVEFSDIQSSNWVAFTRLPSRLLDGGDILSENRSINQKDGSSTDSISNGFGSSGSFSSGLSSPFGSELGSTETETESDEDDDFIAELTRQMADYMLEEDEDDDENAGASDCASQDLKNTFSGSDCNSGSTDSHSERLRASSDHQTRAIQYYKLENQPFVKHQGSACGGRRVKATQLTQQLGPKLLLQHKRQDNVINEGGRADAVCGGGGFGPSATAWPPLQPRRQQQKQQQVGSGSGMRAVFLGAPRSSCGSCGTGVFLPRATGDPSELRKKPGCSTVLIPARVMQALQPHFQEMNARSQSNGCGGFKGYPLHQGNNNTQLQGKRQSQSRTRPAVNHHEMVLPKEWTY